MIRVLTGLIFFILVLVQGILLFPQSGDRVRPQLTKELPTSDRLQEPEQVLFGGHLVEAQQDKKVWELWSEKAIKGRGSEDWHLYKVKVHFFGDGKKTYTAIGEEGFVTGDQKKLEIVGDVHVLTSGGYKLGTERITYLSGEGDLLGPDPVNVVGPKSKKEFGQLSLKAKSFRGNLNQEKIFLVGSVAGKKPMSEGRTMKINSRKAMINGKNHHAQFNGNVVIRVNTLRASGPNAKFVFRGGEVELLLMSRGVTLKDETKTGRANMAKIYIKEDKAVFTGKPRVIDGNDEIEGEKITLLEGGDRVQVVSLKSKYFQKEKKEGE